MSSLEGRTPPVAFLVAMIVVAGCVDTGNRPPMVATTSTSGGTEPITNQDVLRECNTNADPHRAPYSAPEIENATNISSQERLSPADRKMLFQIASGELKTWNGTRYQNLEGTLAPTSPTNADLVTWRLDLHGHHFGADHYILEFKEGSQTLASTPQRTTVGLPSAVWNQTVEIINRSDVGHLSPSRMTWGADWDWCISVVLHSGPGNRGDTRDPYYEAIVDIVAGQVLNVERRSWDSPSPA